MLKYLLLLSYYNQALGQISRSFHFRDRHTFPKLYVQFVRCHLESSTVVWNPWSSADIEILENVQIRAVNLVSGLSGKTYQEKLSELNLQSLHERRIRFDMIQTFKILKSINNVDYRTWFETMGDTVRRETRQASHPLNLVHKNVRTDVRKHFFSVRVQSRWNNLPDAVKNSVTVNGFKNAYDELCRQGSAVF